MALVMLPGLALLLKFGELVAQEHNPEQIKKYATEVVYDSTGAISHWKINGVWYSNSQITKEKDNIYKEKNNVINDFIIRQPAPDPVDIFSALNDSTLLWYGSGDVNGDNLINHLDLDSLLKIPFGTRTDTATLKYDRADVTGDGIVDLKDSVLFSDYLDNKISYLPSHWNKLRTREERVSWIKKMIKIDKTDTLKWIRFEFVCSDFAWQAEIRFRGVPDFADTNIVKKLTEESPQYNTRENGRFNIPLLSSGINAPLYNLLHVINSCSVGDDPLNCCDFYYFEPQDDCQITIGGGRKDIPKNTESLENTFFGRQL